MDCSVPVGSGAAVCVSWCATDFPRTPRRLGNSETLQPELRSKVPDKGQPEPFSSWQVFVQVGRYPVLARAVYMVYWSMIMVSCWFEQSLHTHSSSSDSFQPLA